MGLLKNKRLTKENKKEQVKEEQNLVIENKEPEEIKFCRLDKEIKREQMKRRINSFKKSQKPKKSLKKRLLAWGLGVSIFAGAVAGIG